MALFTLLPVDLLDKMTAVNSKTDAELMELITYDNYTAFEAIYTRYASSIKRILVKVVKSEEQADDICQDIFLNFWVNRCSVKHIKCLNAYLFTIARNRAIDSLKAAVRKESTLTEIIQKFDAQRNTTDDELLDKEYSLFLERILQTLPERSRQVFSLCREHGKSYEEVAEMLDISRSAVKNHMVLSMKILRGAAKREFGLSLGVLFACIFRH